MEPSDNIDCRLYCSSRFESSALFKFCVMSAVYMLFNTVWILIIRIYGSHEKKPNGITCTMARESIRTFVNIYGKRSIDRRFLCEFIFSWIRLEE